MLVISICYAIMEFVYLMLSGRYLRRITLHWYLVYITCGKTSDNLLLNIICCMMINNGILWFYCNSKPDDYNRTGVWVKLLKHRVECICTHRTGVWVKDSKKHYVECICSSYLWQESIVNILIQFVYHGVNFESNLLDIECLKFCRLW